MYDPAQTLKALLNLIDKGYYLHSYTSDNLSLVASPMTGRDLIELPCIPNSWRGADDATILGIIFTPVYRFPDGIVAIMLFDKSNVLMDYDWYHEKDFEEYQNQDLYRNILHDSQANSTFMFDGDIYVNLNLLKVENNAQKSK